MARFAAALLLCAAGATAFPVYTSMNGSVLVQSAFGGDVVFAPSAGGARWSRRQCAPA